MLRTLLLLVIVVLAVSPEYFSRGGAAAPQEFESAAAPLRRHVRNPLPQSPELAVEVFQVLDLPLVVYEASLVKPDKSFLLRLSLGNSSEVKLVGLRYSLATIDSNNETRLLSNRIEGFSLPAYGTKTVTFKTPLKLKQKSGERLVVMVEQVISRETIWEVIKAKEALEAYGRGDYSVRPAVLRVANSVDVPPGTIGMKFRRN
jgi:hypothetical protein